MDILPGSSGSRPGVIDVELQFEITLEIYADGDGLDPRVEYHVICNGILLGRNLKSKEILNRNTYRFT